MFEQKKFTNKLKKSGQIPVKEEINRGFFTG